MCGGRSIQGKFCWRSADPHPSCSHPSSSLPGSMTSDRTTSPTASDLSIPLSQHRPLSGCPPLPKSPVAAAAPSSGASITSNNSRRGAQPASPLHAARAAAAATLVQAQVAARAAAEECALLTRASPEAWEAAQAAASASDGRSGTAIDGFLDEQLSRLDALSRSLAEASGQLAEMEVDEELAASRRASSASQRDVHVAHTGGTTAAFAPPADSTQLQSKPALSPCSRPHSASGGCSRRTSRSSATASSAGEAVRAAAGAAALAAAVSAAALVMMTRGRSLPAAASSALRRGKRGHRTASS